MLEPVNIFWFRRDLRIDDNIGFINALNAEFKVLPIFIFDTNILEQLNPSDARVTFIHECLQKINLKLASFQSSIQCFIGNPIEIWKKLIQTYNIQNVYTNKDYEPYGLNRDREVYKLLKDQNISFHRFKDHVIFEEKEITKADGNPYTIYTPYKNAWLKKLASTIIITQKPNLNKLVQQTSNIPTLKEIGFIQSDIKIKEFEPKNILGYQSNRDFPAKNHTSFLGPHLRFGTISIRQLVLQYKSLDDIFINELIWREFFIQILYHFPKAVTQSFKPKYDNIQWLNDLKDFENWCNGTTGYPIVDAGMKELNQTGYMHNRVRMICASFLCKHLLIDWRWGEAYFAQKLLDYELASNNGNWQWAAGTGCDAAPYFRVFNPTIQAQKFDKENLYIQKWIPHYNQPSYPKPIIEHSFARERAINTYKKYLTH